VEALSSRLLWEGRARLPVLLPLVLATIPAVLITATVARYGLNVPFTDEFGFVRSEAFEGHLRFELLWEQHNEHRPLLPRLIMLGLARMSDWDIRYELAANIAVALGLLAVLILLVSQTVHALAPSLKPWLILAASLTTFSLAQFENWLAGFALTIFMNALAAALTVWALVRWGLRWPGLAVALLAAIGGALSFASGLLLLVLIPVWFLLPHQHHEGRVSRGSLAVAVLVPASVIALYFVDFHYPGHHPSPYYLFSRPLSYGRYVLTYIGAALSFNGSKRIAMCWGATGIAAFAGCGVWLWTRSAAHRHVLLPWLLLALYAVLSGFMTGVGRAGFGVGQALSPRYVTISSLFWLSVIVVVALAIAHFLKDEAVSRTSALAVVAVTTSIATLGAVSYGMTWSRAEAWVKAHHAALLRGRECLLSYDRAPDECLRLLFAHPIGAQIVRQYARQWEALKLGPFAPSQRERPLSSYTLVGGPGPAGFIDHVAVSRAAADGAPPWGEVGVSGWARDPFARRPAASVLIVVDGQVMGRAPTGERRPDVARALRQKGFRRSGWAFRFGVFRLAPGPHLVEAYAVLDDDRRIVRLAGSRSIEVSE